ncbi:MurR/RpiR family transcriptional regulator [Nesterenkonia sphaerica]|uniref:MurR/RpiR family transcriptional regulator n=1 Tax=Nesterenkonia sphaerica TaxID=1804988 RepID=A0A5R9A967_9MICC|nr:MurR/RpiR family transcriptional regulator [Nesterenkonia sphaerica]TLP75289.1 MurR/RpiR family transcriptional regulator [Nesterenkonia sphaerica]
MAIESYDQLAAALQARRSAGLAPGQERIADLLLRDPEGTAFRTIAQTAELAAVNQSSVVRFAQSLGLPGYAAVVGLCRAQVTQQANLVSRFDLVEGSSSDDMFAAVLHHEQENLRRTYSRIVPEVWQEAVRTLAAAPRVHVLGLRKCASVAQLLAYLLGLVRPQVFQLAPAEGGLVDELRNLEAGDAFIAASIRRYTASTVQGLRYAREKGLTTIALTDDRSSPLAQLADHVFLIETEGVTILRSLSVFTSLSQTLATAVAVERGAEARSELLVDEQLLEQFGVYED